MNVSSFFYTGQIFRPTWDFWHKGCWTGESGCGYRYPIYYCKNKEDFENRELTKDYIIIRELDPEYIQTMKYKFGSNHLYIGDGIVDALKFLEEKYDINFNELEQKKIDKREQELARINKKLENGETVIIDSGQKIVGIDIPVGKFKIETTSESSDIYMVICDMKMRKIQNMLIWKIRNR